MAQETRGSGWGWWHISVYTSTVSSVFEGRQRGTLDQNLKTAIESETIEEHCLQG